MLKQILAGITIGAIGIGAGFAGGAVYKDKTIDVTQKDEYKQVVNDKNDLNTKLDATKLALANLTTQRDSLEATKKQLEGQLATAQKQLNDKTAELESKHAELESADERIKVLNAQIATLETDAEANAEQITALQGQVTSLTNAKTSLESDISNLQTDIEECNLQINNLQSSISDKNSELTELNAKINKLYSTKTKFTGFSFDAEKRFNLYDIDGWDFNYFTCPNNKILMTISSSQCESINDETKGLWEYDPFFDTLEKIDENIIKIIPIDKHSFFVQCENIVKICYFNEASQISEYGQLSATRTWFQDIAFQDESNLILNVRINNDGNTYDYVVHVDKIQNKVYQYSKYRAISGVIGDRIIFASTTSGSDYKSIYNINTKNKDTTSKKEIEYRRKDGIIWKNTLNTITTYYYYNATNGTEGTFTIPIKTSYACFAFIEDEILIGYASDGYNNDVKVISFNMNTKTTKDVTFESAVEEISAPSYIVVQNFQDAVLIENKYYTIVEGDTLYLYSYNKENLIIKCEKISGTLPFAVNSGALALKTIVRNGQIYKIYQAWKEYNNKMYDAFIYIYKADLNDMNMTMIEAINCEDAIGQNWGKYYEGLSVADDESTITIVSSFGYTYVYDFESSEYFGETKFEL